MEAELSEVQVADNEWWEQKIAFEGRPENAIVVENPPSQWNRNLAAIKAQFQKEFKANKALADRHQKPKPESGRWTGPDMDGLEYGMLERRGWIFSSGGIRVSPATFERAFSIANSIFMASSNRGCEMSIDGDRGHMILELEQTTLRISIRERQKRESFGQEKRAIPTNKLVIVIEKPAMRKSEVIDSSQPLEVKLSDVFLHLYREVFEGRARGRVETAKKIKQAIEWEAYEEISRQSALVVARKAQREMDVKDLLGDASRWHDAQHIRGFVAQVASHPAVTNRAAVDAWAQWALEVADETDSLPGRIAALNKDE